MPPEAELNEISAAYLAFVGNPGGDASRITDKMPTDFRNLGLVAQLFPNARIIHSRRDPMDTSFSCDMQNLQGTGNACIDDLDWLGHYYGLYRKLMDHRQSVLPTPMFEIDYEALVADQEAENRRLVDFLGLERDGACLDFQSTERAVATASFTQMRQPIYRSNIGQWRRFETQMKPLADRLDKSIYTVSPQTAGAGKVQRPEGPTK